MLGRSTREDESVISMCYFLSSVHSNIGITTRETTVFPQGGLLGFHSNSEVVIRAFEKQTQK